MSLENPSLLEKLINHKGAVLAGIVTVLILVTIAFFYGSHKGRVWADSDYLRERDAKLQEIAILEDKAKEHANREKELAVLNDQLKAQNEATAEILKKNDAVIAGNATKFIELQKERENKQNEIENTSDANSIDGLCRDAKSAGFVLSFCK